MIVTPDMFGQAAERVARCPSRVVDLETTGVKRHQGDRLFAVAVEADGAAFYFPFRHEVGWNLEPSKLHVLLDILVAPGSEMTGHNSVRFDSPMIAAEGPQYYDRLMRPGGVRQYDTIVDALLANENEPSFSLEALSVKYLGADVGRKKEEKARLMELLKAANPGIRKQRELMGRLAHLTPEQVGPYAIGDVLDTKRLREVYAKHHREWSLEKLADEMYDYARLLAVMEWRGLCIDRALAEQRIPLIEQAEARVLDEIRQLAGPKFNPNSAQQVCALLGTDDAQKETLALLEHPVAQKIVEYKRLGKVRSTYYEGILNALDAENVVHPQLNLTPDQQDRGGTRTGRLSCSHPNFQNLPKRAVTELFAVRDLVIARPGHVFLVADYERAEMWMGAHYSRDESLADAYHAGRDLYQELAERNQVSRQRSKIDWLSIQYGIGAEKLSRSHGWAFTSIRDLECRFDKVVEEWGDREWRIYMAQRGPALKQSFFEMCPGIRQQMRDLSERAARVGCLRLWTGRVRHFDGRRSRPFAAWNGIIQGGVGEQVRIAMQRLEEPLAEYRAAQVLQVHDEIVTETPEEALPQVAELQTYMMTNFPQFWLRPRVELSVARRYGRPEPLQRKAA